VGFDTADDVLEYYRGLRATSDGRVSDYEGYSEPALKRVVLSTALSLPGRDVVELGCGPNPVTLFALAEGGRRVSAAELSGDFCRNARSLAERRGLALRIENASADATPFDSNAFDIVLLTEVLEHVPEEQDVLAEARRILRPGGRLVISGPNEQSLFQRYLTWRNGFVEDNPEHLREYTVDRLRVAVEKAEFVIERALRVPSTVEPPWRTKAAWVLDRIAVRPEWGLKAALVARKPATP
jgi:2-polyprenyl-3-methyl-5-hydroxy-6-metoxy-1,4-benzoquinol methylase